MYNAALFNVQKSVGAPVGLPNSSRVACTSAEMGLKAAKYCSHVGSAVIGTNAFDRNVSGKIQMRPAVLAVSVFGTDKPT